MIHTIKMKRAHSISLIILFAELLIPAGCKTREASSNTPAGNSAAARSSPTTNVNQLPQTSDANRSASPGKEAETAANAKPSGPAQLLGTYESREVQDQGVITLITQLKTLWMFASDGTYSRVSQVKGKPYHADSGTFRIEPPDKLLLSIQVTGLKTQRKVQSPPLSKTHKFSLSPDGEELRLTSEKGSVGVFRRVAKPSAQ